MDDTLDWAILETLSYAAIFSYPLKKEEIFHYLIYRRSVAFKQVSQAVKELVRSKLVRESHDKTWFSLWETTIKDRKVRERISRRKLTKVMPVLWQLSRLPTIQLIGISGAVAWKNATYADDVDVFIVTSAKTIWLTRALCMVITDMHRARRKAHETRVAGKLCLNMFVDTDHLGIPFPERDLFSAYEVVRMRPIFIRGNTHKKFLWENRWVKELLGNTLRRITNENKFSLFNFHFSILLYPLEFIAKTLQLWYMRKRRTNEVIQEGYIRFHPRDARPWILRRHRWRLAQLRRQFTRIKTNRVSHPGLFADA